MNLELFDDRGRVLRSMDEQAQNLERVAGRLAGSIREFFDLHMGQTFHAERLREWVDCRCGKTAPGSADRIMRLMRGRGAISYELVSRSKSLYRVIA